MNVRLVRVSRWPAHLGRDVRHPVHQRLRRAGRDRAARRRGARALPQGGAGPAERPRDGEPDRRSGVSARPILLEPAHGGRLPQGDRSVFAGHRGGSRVRPGVRRAGRLPQPARRLGRRVAEGNVRPCGGGRPAAVAREDAPAEAHASLALVRWVYEWDPGGAEEEFRRAIALNAGYATAHQWLGSAGLAGAIRRSGGPRSSAPRSWTRCP